MRSEKRMTARMMCSIMMMVMPWALRRKRISRMSSTSVLDSPAIASSEIRSLGCAAIARASSSLRISIWVSAPGRRWVFASRPMLRRMSSALALPGAPARAAPAYSSEMPSLSRSVMLVTGFGLWKVRPVPRRLRRWGGIPVISCPSKRMDPPFTGSTPDTQLMRVVFPEPFGPMRPKRSPGFTDKLTPFRAVKPPKRLTTPSTSSSAAATSAAPHAAHEAQEPRGGKHDEQHQHHAHDEEVHLRRDGHDGDLLRGAEEHGADHRADPARGAADHGHGEGVHRVVEGERRVGLDERDVVGKRRPRHPEEEAAHRGREELEAQGRHAHALGRLLAVPQRGQPAAD